MQHAPDKNQSNEHQAILLFLFFFFVVAAFWTLKPLRTSSVVKDFGIELYPLLKQGLVVIIPVIFFIYSIITEKLSRKKLVYLVAGFFFAANMIFSVLLTHAPVSGIRLAFFFYVDTYITVMVTVFWTYANDFYKEAGARRTYGFVGTGGLAGGVLGALVSGWASEILGNNIVLVSALFMLPVFVIVGMLEKGAGVQGPAVQQVHEQDPRARKVRTFTEGITTVFGSRYLMAIVVIVGAYEIISTIVDFQFTAAAAAAYDTRDAMAGFQGKVFFVGQIVSVAVQLLLTSFIHRRFGAAAGLAFLPLAMLLGATAILVIPGLTVAAFIIGSEAAFGYSINQTSKEILYISLDPVAKFKGKAFIDMFVLRIAKTVGALILLGHVFWLEPWGIGPWFLSLIVLVLIAFWLAAVRYMHRTIEHTPLGEQVVRPSPTPWIPTPRRNLATSAPKPPVGALASGSKVGSIHPAWRIANEARSK